jgi:hypothetical protein
MKYIELTVVCSLGFKIGLYVLSDLGCCLFRKMQVFLEIEESIEPLGFGKPQFLDAAY